MYHSITIVLLGEKKMVATSVYNKEDVEPFMFLELRITAARKLSEEEKDILSGCVKLLRSMQSKIPQSRMYIEGCG